MNYNIVMQNAVPTGEENLLLTIAKFSIHLQQRYGITDVVFPPKTQTTANGIVGQGMAVQMMELVKQSIGDSLEQIKAKIKEIRNQHVNYFSSREVRQACRVYAHEWAFLEERKRKLTRDDTSMLLANIDILLNLYLSPIGIVEPKHTMAVHGISEPMTLAGFDGAEFTEHHMVKVYGQIGNIVGMLDWLDDDSSHRVAGMWPNPLVPPHWYFQDDIDGAWSMSMDEDSDVYDALCNEYLMLETDHRISIQNGFVDSIHIAEFDGDFGSTPYRLLVAVVYFEQISAGDVYLALWMPDLTRTQLLVGQEAHGSGLCVIRDIYQAYFEALEEEGEYIDMDDFIDELLQKEDVDL